LEEIGSAFTLETALTSKPNFFLSKLSKCLLITVETLTFFQQLQNATDRLDQEDVNLKLLLGEINSTLFLKVMLIVPYKYMVFLVDLQF